MVPKEERLPAEEALDTRHHLIQVSFRQRPGDTGPACKVHKLRVKEDSAKQDWNLWGELADLPGRLNPVLAGHHEIKHNNVWSEFPRPANGIFSVDGFSTDLPSPVAAQKPSKTVSNDRTVIGDQNTGGHAASEA